tara:strand:- start:11696 stop:11965 length:270 start_codon:yes stop_codon:yes gene_type:complete
MSKNPNYDPIRQILLKSIQPKLCKVGISIQNVSDDTDLLQSGIMDSFDLIELIENLEDTHNLKFDLAEVKEENFTEIGVLISEIIRQNG